MRKIFLFTALLFSMVSCLNASVCNDYEHDHAEYLAEQAGNDYVQNHMNGGQNIVVTLEKCEYNTYSKQFRVKIDINWDGALISSNHYEVDGILKLNSDGSNSFSQTWANQEVQNLSFWTSVAAGAIILNDLSQQQPK